jgi:hypothetical protein
MSKPDYEPGIGFSENDEVCWKILYKSEWESMVSNLSLLDGLSQHNLAPKVLKLEPIADRYKAYLERIYGFDLNNFPDNFQSLRYSLEFGQRLASLSIGMNQLRAYQYDGSLWNFMYDTKNNRCVVVDLDSVSRGDESASPYIRQYSVILSSVWLGESIEFHIMDLEDSGKLEYYMPTTWERYQQAQHENGFIDFEIINDFAAEPVRNLLEERNVLGLINPNLLQIVMKGLDKRTVPNDINELVKVVHFP